MEGKKAGPRAIFFSFWGGDEMMLFLLERVGFYASPLLRGRGPSGLGNWSSDRVSPPSIRIDSSGVSWGGRDMWRAGPRALGVAFCSLPPCPLRFSIKLEIKTISFLGSAQPSLRIRGVWAESTYWGWGKIKNFESLSHLFFFFSSPPQTRGESPKFPLVWIEISEPTGFAWKVLVLPCT